MKQKTKDEIEEAIRNTVKFYKQEPKDPTRYIPPIHIIAPPGTGIISFLTNLESKYEFEVIFVVDEENLNEKVTFDKVCVLVELISLTLSNKSIINRKYLRMISIRVDE